MVYRLQSHQLVLTVGLVAAAVVAAPALEIDLDFGLHLNFCCREEEGLS